MTSLLKPIALLLLLAPQLAFADPREDGYIAERNALIAKFSALDQAGKSDDHLVTESTAALDGLEKKLVAIIGIDKIKGLPAQPKFNLDTLFKTDVGYGSLDALAYQTPDYKTRVIVTTPTLLTRWLKEHEHWWEKEALPQSLDLALRTEAFYTQAISADAAVVTYGELPMARPAGALHAVALFAAQTQDESPRSPDEIIVAVVGAEHAIIAVTPIRTKIAPIPACVAIWKDLEKKQKALAGKPDTGDKINQMREDADKNYRRCFTERAKTAPFFQSVTREAERFLAGLPLR